MNLQIEALEQVPLGGTTIPLLIQRALNFNIPLINLTFLCVEVNALGGIFYSINNKK